MKKINLKNIILRNGYLCVAKIMSCFGKKKSEDFDEKQFPINIRVELYSKVTKSLMDLCNNIMNFELDFKEATMEELKKLETAGDKFYRKFKFIFHPDK